MQFKEIFKKFVKIFAIISSVFIVGCAQSTEKELRISGIGGDLWIRSIASDNISETHGSTTVDTDVEGIPMEGIPGIVSKISGNGIFADHSVTINDVSGSVYIEEAGNRNNQQDIEAILQHLFTPGNPFED